MIKMVSWKRRSITSHVRTLLILFIFGVLNSKPIWHVLLLKELSFFPQTTPRKFLDSVFTWSTFSKKKNPELYWVLINEKVGNCISLLYIPNIYCHVPRSLPPNAFWGRIIQSKLQALFSKVPLRHHLSSECRNPNSSSPFRSCN
jgi:hypothetical protein